MVQDKPSRAAYMREWTARNRERVNAQRRARWAVRTTEQKERNNEWHREWKRAHPEQARAYYHKRSDYWRQYHREYKRDRDVRRRANGGATDAEWLAVLRSDPCSYCRGPGGEIDHITPVRHGGAGDWENLTGACHSCNARKKDRSLLSALMLAAA